MMSLQVQMEEQEGSGRKGADRLGFFCSQKSIHVVGYVAFVVVVVALIQQALAATGGAAP
jgi:hypothetical protein